MLKKTLKRILPEFVKKRLNKAGFYASYNPKVGHVNLGDLDRLYPFSIDFGYDRGGPVDRYYIEDFLFKNAADIKGRCLEIGDNEYTLLYGQNNVIKSDILHVDDSNKKATFIGDLSNAPQIPDDIFDCIVLTQTLHLIYDFKAALATCHRVLKPGGVLLLTSPGITPIDHGGWKSTWYWSFTDKALFKLGEETFPGAEVNIETFGNVFIATAFLHGMGLPEITAEKLEHQDPHYQVIIGVRIIKAKPVNA
jgi:SAM-dependent methyltransferase